MAVVSHRLPLVVARLGVGGPWIGIPLWLHRLALDSIAPTGPSHNRDRAGPCPAQVPMNEMALKKRSGAALVMVPVPRRGRPSQRGVLRYGGAARRRVERYQLGEA